MELLQEKRISCPYCGEAISIALDLSQGDHHFIEDCSVCCKPIEFSILLSEDSCQLVARRDDE